MRRQACWGIILLALSPMLHAFEIAPYTASYEFNLDNKLSGTATRVLEKEGDGLWRYTFSANAPIATATETSRFRFDGKTVTPLGYQQKRKIFFVKRTASVDFNWKTGKATGNRQEKPPASYALNPGTLDSLNMEIQIRRDLTDLGKLGGPYALASPKDITPLVFVVEGSETLNTPMGKLDTLRVSRKHDDPTRHTTFWLAKKFGYLPAKVTQDDDGSIYSIELTSFTPAKPPAPKDTAATDKK